jgi:uncharacterized protein involved in exopolysaccharide biosynthesis
MVDNNEFVPFNLLTRIMRFWWVIVLFAVIGGLAGLIIHRLQPPIYEAQAVFVASIDFNKVEFTLTGRSATPVPYQFTQYDEDISLAEVEAALRQVVPQVAEFAQQNGIPGDAASLLAQSTIEREHAYWEVRYRNADPALAQKVVNYWAEQGFSALKTKSSAGQLPPYLTYDLIQLADLPKSPAYFQTNSFVLAGTVIGLVAGLLVINLPFFRMKKEA